MNVHMPKLAFFVACGTILLIAQGVSADSGQSHAGTDSGFVRGDLNFNIDAPTAIAFGPDGRLYVANQEEIVALTLDDATHEVVSVEQIASGLTGTLGLTFDQNADPDGPITVYASHQDMNGISGYWGRVSSFSEPDWTQHVEVNNLPSSAPLLNHMTNSIHFGDDGRLYIAQGSDTDAGLVGEPEPRYYPETPLSGAILVADVNSPGFDGDLIYNPPGEPMDNNVNLISGDVQVFAPGLRNPYDFVIHSNGYLYSTDNGALGGDGAASCDGDVVQTSVNDELNLVEEGNYYGFPNLNRGRTDPRQCTYRDPNDGDGAGVTGPIAVLARHCSCDGIIEYSGPALDGELNGNLIIASFIRGLLYRVQLTENGRGVTDVTTLDSSFDAPLDLALGPDGVIYVADYNDDVIAFLEPAPATQTPTASASESPTATNTPVPTETPEPTATPEDQVGDANCDGNTNSIDAALVLQHVAGLIGGVACAGLADVNGDGFLNAIDAALILQIEAGLL